MFADTSEQGALELQLKQARDAAKAKIKSMVGLQDGLLKDTETALERDFKSMRSVMRKLESLAEDQECVEHIVASTSAIILYPLIRLQGGRGRNRSAETAAISMAVPRASDCLQQRQTGD